MKGDSVKAKSGAALRAQRDRRAPVAAGGSRLAEFKDIIAKGQRNFVEVGTALGLVAKDRLFKEDGYGSFEGWVSAEFDMSSSTAYRLVDAARVVTILSQVGTIQSKITNQAQALALAPLVKDRDAMVLVIAAAEQRTGRLTADLLADVRVELYPHTQVIDGEVVTEKPALVKGVRRAIEQAAASVGAGVAFTAPQPQATLCPVPRNLDICGICGDLLREKNAGYLRCPTCDPRQEHIAEATLDGQWAECRLCHPTSAASVAAANTDNASPAVGEPVDAEQAAAEAGAPDGGSVPCPPSGVTHEQENGWAGEPGQCGVSCTCGAMWDGFETLTEPLELLKLHIANPEERIDEEAADPPASDATAISDTPAAATASLPDGDGDPMPELPRQPGQDSPTGAGIFSDPEVPAVATARSETSHHRLSEGWGGGEAPEGFTLSDAPVELEDGDSPAVSSPSSSDPRDEPTAADLLLQAMGSLAEALGEMDPEAMGPYLFPHELVQLHQHADRIAEFVGRIDRASPHTP